MELEIQLHPHCVRWFFVHFIIAAIVLTAFGKNCLNVCATAMTGTQYFNLKQDNDCESGILIARDKTGNKSLGRCPLKLTEVDAKIAGFVGRVIVKQHFQNYFNKPIEAVYTFPLPNNAAVDRMTMRIGKRTITGVIRRRQDARSLYERAKQEGRSASLLDEERPNVFTQSVANINPGENIEVEIAYVNQLKFSDGKFEFSFPTVVGPRFFPDEMLNAAKAKEHRSSPDYQLLNISRVNPPVNQSTRSGHDIAIHVSINSGAPITEISSELHDVDVRRVEPNKVEVRLNPGDKIPNRDFVLSWGVAQDKIGSGYLTHCEQGDGVFTAFLIPPKRVNVESLVPKEIIFLLDCSGSQRGEPLAKAKETIQYILEKLGPNDRFRILAFNNTLMEYSNYPCKSTEEERNSVSRYLSHLDAEGGTWLSSAVDRVCQLPRNNQQLRIVVFMSDGYVANDVEIIETVKKYRADTRWFPFGTGNAVNRFLLDEIARVGGGEAEYVLLPSRTIDFAQRFYERISSPILSDVKVSFEGVKLDQIFPREQTDLWAQRPLIVTGKYKKPGTGCIVFSGIAAGRTYRHVMPITLPLENKENDALNSIWARSKIDSLMSSNYREVQNQATQKLEYKSQVEKIALKYHLMSRYTSFVALDKSEKKHHGSSTVNIPLEAPDGVCLCPSPKEEKGSEGAAFYCSGSSQPTFSDEDGKDIYVATKGTVQSFDGNVLTLERGKVLALMDKKAGSIQTKQGRIELPPGCTALIEVCQNNAIRIAVLSSKLPAKYNFCSESESFKSLFMIPSGQELCLGAAEIGAEKLIPIDGVDREENSTKQFGNFIFIDNKFDQKMMMEANKSLFTIPGDVNIARVRISKVKATLSRNHKRPETEELESD